LGGLVFTTFLLLDVSFLKVVSHEMDWLLMTWMISSGQYKIIGAPKNFNKWPRPLFRPKTNLTCHQKPNPSRETVALKAGIFVADLDNLTSAS
jgi:hypothetical protein